MRVRSLAVFADYFQFYLWDAGTNPSAPVHYAPPDGERRLKTGTNAVAILTARNMTVPVTVEIDDSEPLLDINAWDHVVEASLHVPTGHFSCTSVREARSPTLKSCRAAIAYDRVTADWIRSIRLASTAWITIT
jgi:hypothetical protein